MSVNNLISTDQDPNVKANIDFEVSADQEMIFINLLGERTRIDDMDAVKFKDFILSIIQNQI